MNNLSIVIANKLESLEGIKHYTLKFTEKSILVFAYNDASKIEMTLNTSHGGTLSLLMSMCTSYAQYEHSCIIH
jgi:hypothetical protein